MILSKPKPEQDEKGRFLPGNNGGTGRPKGSRNQLGEAFIADLYEDWKAHGSAAIKKMRNNNPADYVKVVAFILPKDLNVNVSLVERMTDEELNATIERLLAEREIWKKESPSTEH